jgi:hypothetical protein
MKCSTVGCRHEARVGELCRFHAERLELMRRRREQRAIAERERGEKESQ